MMHGQFSVIKAYGNDEIASKFSVSNPHKSKAGGHYVYVFEVNSISPYHFYFILPYHLGS